jgi:hypothetical protein
VERRRDRSNYGHHDIEARLIVGRSDRRRVRSSRSGEFKIRDRE